MRDRTKELEKLKKELAQLKNKEDEADESNDAEASDAAVQQSASDEYLYHGLALQPDAGGMSTLAEWAGVFPPQWGQNMESLEAPYFACSPPPHDSVSVSSRSSASSKKRRISGPQMPPRTNTASSTSTMASQGSHRRSRSHTPMASPSLGREPAASPNPAAMADLQQASQLLSLSPCDFALGRDPLDTMSLPQLESDGAFLDGFMTAEARSCSAPTTFHPDQGLWTALASPPLHSSAYTSYLTPSPPEASSPWTGGPAASPSPNLLPANVDDAGSSRRPSTTALSSSYASSAASSVAGRRSPSLSNTSTSSPSLTKDATARPRSSSLLHLAVAGGHASVLKMLLQRCDIPVDARDAAGYTALQRAVFAGRSEMVALLLEHGADFCAGQQADGLSPPGALAASPAPVVSS